MPRHASTADVVAAVAAIAGRPGTHFVGIDGPGGAGKSTLAVAVAAGVPAAVVVHVDDFSGPGVPEWDFARLREQLLMPLLEGRPARYQVWDWDADEGGEWLDVPPGRVVVIEGVSSTRAEVGAPWELTVWVQAPAAVRRERAIARDGVGMWPTWENDWIPKEQAYIAREQPQRRVDLVVDGVDGVDGVEGSDGSRPG